VRNELESKDHRLKISRYDNIYLNHCLVQFVWPANVIQDDPDGLFLPQEIWDKIIEYSGWKTSIVCKSFYVRGGIGKYAKKLRDTDKNLKYFN